jgi:glutaredoxin
MRGIFKTVMKKFLIIVGLVTVVIIAGGIKLFSKPEAPLSPPTSYELYTGEGCPHCEIVKDFLSTWEGKDKVKIEEKEVWYNKENASLLQRRAIACGINPNNMGVPFMVTPEGKCLDGDQPIIDHLKSLDLTK